MGVEFKDNNNNKKKSIFEVPKNLNYLFAGTGLILDIWGLIGSFFFCPSLTAFEGRIFSAGPRHAADL